MINATDTNTKISSSPGPAPDAEAKTETKLGAPDTTTTLSPKPLTGEMLLPEPKPSISPEQMEELLREQEAASKYEQQILTGVACLQPVTKACISRLLDLLRDKPAPSEPAGPSSKELLERLLPLETLGALGDWLRDGLGYFFGDAKPSPSAPAPTEKSMSEEILEGGISRFFRELAPSTPPEADCEVKKDASGEIRVECTAQ